jgi:DNA-binding transcriptional MerR regulator
MGVVTIGEFARLARLSPKALRIYDQSGLLPPARVDPATGYRWYSTEQVEQARLVSSLRQLGMPLAEIKPVLQSDPACRAGRIADWWADVEAEHAARRTLVGYLADVVTGREDPMSDRNRKVELRDMPARSVLCQMRHVTDDEALAVGKAFIGSFREASIRPQEGIAGAPFVIYYGEVNQDSDGPVEWCWPVPDHEAADLAARFPHLTLRTDTAHQEAFIHQGMAAHIGPAQAVLAVETLMAWTIAQQRQPIGGVRQVFIMNAANGDKGPDSDLALALR